MLTAGMGIMPALPSGRLQGGAKEWRERMPAKGRSDAGGTDGARWRRRELRRATASESSGARSHHRDRDRERRTA
jgi:hypothetical protein